jgi:hypothetical protein
MEKNNVIVYQRLYLNSESYIRKLLLTWDTIKTIIPKEFESTTNYHKHSDNCSPLQFDFNLYKKINDAAQDNVVGYFIVSESDRYKLLDSMFELLERVIKIKPLHESLKWSNNNIATDHWFLLGGIEKPLAELLIEYQMASVLTHPVLTIKAGNLFNEIVGNYIKERYGFDLVSTDVKDEFYEKKLNISNYNNLLDISTLSLLIPDLYIPDIIYKISLNEFFKVRQDLNLLRREYLAEIDRYKSEINMLTNNGDDEKAFEILCEFYQRINISFQTYFNLAKKLLRPFKIEKVQTIISGIKILSREFPAIVTYCDFLQLFFSIFNIGSKEKINNVGFDYLIDLDKQVKLMNFKNKLNIFKGGNN